MCFFLPEPATPPQNVETMAPSSTEIMVTWEEVPAIDENGIITNYEVQFEPLEFTETLSTSSISTSNLTVVIRNLQEYVQYSLSVRAYTIVGPGPYSDPVTQRTLEDRKLVHMCLILEDYWPFLLKSRTSHTSTECPSHSHLLHSDHGDLG